MKLSKFSLVYSRKGNVARCADTSFIKSLKNPECPFFANWKKSKWIQLSKHRSEP